MDRLTQLQDSIDQLALMFVSSVDYLQGKSAMVTSNPEFPVTKANERADPPDVFKKSTRELAADICKHAKQIDTLVEALPGIKHTEADQIRLLETLDQENAVVCAQYEEQLVRAKTLLKEVTDTLRVITDDQSQS
ncbi:hypothetical protein K493DRAFT_337171 [Basidiobolus meristosporus CBS 931.73]|uniref:Mediator of RNA polymerase II transcription subunit 21 n=1 Tax=Basidiobolus meristosporus CBS 931.73 TaxID=1314790 RepID=A0A1Y1YE36_9FUNG|nr:hypothetical protein K493DRAFT_337171 [Basidiobolus meristosporus CBS 931.73]|eukprot:ORX95864.1 hypothetical protein K493DRAFT_337171 [Basidiobolus meristosporus CBS 931.73]